MSRRSKLDRRLCGWVQDHQQTVVAHVKWEAQEGESQDGDHWVVVDDHPPKMPEGCLSIGYVFAYPEDCQHHIARDVVLRSN